MSKHNIHAAHCRCPQCAPRHPSAAEISPGLRIVVFGVSICAGLAVVGWLSAVVADSLSSWS